MRLATVRHRIHADFLMPSRLDAYDAMLRAILDAGYTVWSIEGFWQVVRDRADALPGRHVVMRHDVDTDPATAAAMWGIDRSLGVGGSYYFRRSTVDVPLMRAIAEGGGEASYHYEEVATLAKRYRIREPDEARRRIPEAQALFRRNIERLRAATGLAMPVVASHGDFVNRRLGIANWVLLEDEAFRRSVGVELEAYDEAFTRHVTSRSSDTLHPRYWVTEDPLVAVRRGDPVVSVLVHPRHWYARRLVNARDDAWRMAESLAYRIPSPGRRR